MGNDFQSHLRNIAAVLTRLLNAGLKVNPAKCQFFKEEVTFLGYIVSNHSISPDPNKTNKIAAWPTPSSQQQLQQFLVLLATTDGSFGILPALADHFTNSQRKKPLFTGQRSVTVLSTV
uniref:Reverse transcriptase domain-containing protein n=1 Tax=Amphimedon queenslandica TaxID=400682 RepID=A0A1X7TXP6_AMPQE